MDNMALSLKNPFKYFWEIIVVKSYVRYGLLWGDLQSYSFLAEYDRDYRLFKLWEKRYEALGYVPLTEEMWIWEWICYPR